MGPAPNWAMARAGRPVVRRRVRRASLIGAVSLIVAAAAGSVALSGCGDSSGSARAVLARYLAAWGRGDWAAMRSQVVDPPPSFTSTNAQAFHALGVARASFVPVRVTAARSGTARSLGPVSVSALPGIGAWIPSRRFA